MGFHKEITKILGEIPEDSKKVAGETFMEVSHYMGKGFLSWNANAAAKAAAAEFQEELRKIMPPNVFNKIENLDRSEELVQRLKEMIRFRILWDGEKEFDLDAIEFLMNLMHLNVEWFKEQDTTSLWPSFRKFIYFQFLAHLLSRLSHDGNGQAEVLADEIIDEFATRPHPPCAGSHHQ